MFNIKLNKSLNSLLPSLEIENEILINGLSLDSRNIQLGEVFVALQGYNHHGSEYIDDAIAHGASCVFTEQAISQQYSIPILQVEGLKSRIADIAAEFYNYPSRNLELVGITGTNGKSTIAYLLSYLLSKMGERTAQIGTLGIGAWDVLNKNNLTTPDVIQLQKILACLLNDENTTVAMEVSSIGIEEKRVDAVDFNTGIFTNLSCEHLDYHNNMQLYGNAKKKLFTKFNLDTAIINIDDALGAELKQDIPKATEVITYGMSNADFCINKINHIATGMELSINTPNGQEVLTTNLIGEFNAYNILALLAYTSIKGFEIKNCLELCQELPTIPGRMQQMKSKNGVKVFVDFAHTPDAIARALMALKPYSVGKLICIFGCGGERDQQKRAKMGKISSEIADFIYITDDNPRGEKPKDIINDILSGIIRRDKAKVIHDRATAIEEAITFAGAQDVVLIAGKGHEEQQIYQDQKLPFSDLEIAQKVLDRL